MWMLTFVLLCIFFSPYFEVKTYLVRLDQLICPLLILPFLFSGSKYVRNSPKAPLIVICCMLMVGLAGFLREVESGRWDLRYGWKWTLVYALNVMIAYSVVWSTSVDRTRLYRSLLRQLHVIVFVVAVIGLWQVAEHKRYVPTNVVLPVLAEYYPDLSVIGPSVRADAATASRLRMCGIGRLTSTLDGQANFAGDLLAFCLVLLLPTARGVRGISFYSIGVFGLMMTHSRGAALGWAAGVMVYGALLMRDQGLMQKTFRWLGRLAAAGALILTAFAFTPFGQNFFMRYLYMVEMLAAGDAIDGRLTVAWPAVFRMLEYNSLTEWLVGMIALPDFAIDNLYLDLVSKNGLLGLLSVAFMLLSLAYLGYRLGKKAPRGSFATEAGYAFAAAIVTIALTSVVHCVLNQRRLATFLVLTVTLLPSLSQLRPRFPASQSNARFKREHAHAFRDRTRHHRSPLERHPDLLETMRQHRRFRI